jgi:glutathione S-transferase
MPVNTRGQDRQASITPAVREDIERVHAIWGRAGTGGTFSLFGEFCAADIFFAPVATRFRTYVMEAPGRSHTYHEAFLSHP